LVYRKRYSEAEALVQEGIAALEKQPKESCAALGSSYNILALVMWRQGRHDDALSLQQHAVDTAVGCFGPDHPALLKLLNNLAVTFSDMHKTAEAEATFQRALSLGERNVGSDDPFYGELLSNYAAFLRQTNRKNEAKKVAARSQAVLRENARRNGAGLTVDISSFRSQN
jgi:tetratricopeptide (TPR) repeat protein